MPIKYTHYSRLFPDSDHVIMHGQFSRCVTIRQHMLKQVVNTSNFHGNNVTNVNKWYA